MTKQIPLTRNKFALVDDEDYEWLNQWKWLAHTNDSKTFYAARWSPRPFRKIIYMARLVMKTPNGLDCDHINHDTLNNTKENLRNVTRTQNQINTIDRPSKFGRGVARNGSGFRGQISINKQVVLSPTFNTVEEAREWYNKKADELFGEYKRK